MAMQAHALVELSEDEVAAYEAGKKAQAEKRKEERKLVRSTHKSAVHAAKNVKGIQNLLSSGDTDGDGALGFVELTNINPALYETLGLKDATMLLQKYDYNNDGQLDIKERREIITQLIPELDKEANLLNRTGEYTSASFLWQNLKGLKETLKRDHRQEIVDDQHAQEGRFKKVAEKEGLFFRERSVALMQAVEADFDEKERFMARIFQKKLDLLHAQRSKIKNPTAPITTKVSTEVLNIRAKLEALSRTKRPTDVMLLEGSRLQKELHAMEDKHHAQHAMLAPAYFKAQEKELRSQYEANAAKLRALRIKARNKLQHHIDESKASLGYRHKNYSLSLRHAHTVGTQELVVENVRPVRPLPMLPALTSKTPSGVGVLGRLSNGISACNLASDIIPPPGQILRATTAEPAIGPPLGKTL